MRVVDFLPDLRDAFLSSGAEFDGRPMVPLATYQVR